MSNHLSNKVFQGYGSDDEEAEENEEKNRKCQILKECFILDDFLEFPETKEIMEQEFREKFEKECEPNLAVFWEKQVDMCRQYGSTLFKNENDHLHFVTFVDTVFEYITPNYDLELFYNCPDLAENMVKTYTQREKEGFAQRIKDIRENYKQSSENANKKFDWGAKIYKNS